MKKVKNIVITLILYISAINIFAYILKSRLKSVSILLFGIEEITYVQTLDIVAIIIIISLVWKLAPQIIEMLIS